MNERQVNIITKLLSDDNKVYSVEDLSEVFNCSTKTVRNDFKKIDEWLNEEKEINVSLIRKPSVGVYIDGDKAQKKYLRLELEGKETKSLTDDDRKMKIIKMLLHNRDYCTISDLAEQFFTNKKVIRNDLDEIEGWFSKYNLTLERKRRVGIKVSGEEKNWRAALSKIAEFLVNHSYTHKTMMHEWFEPYQVDLIKTRIEQIEKRLSCSFTGQTIDSLTYHLLISIHRIKVKNEISLLEKEISYVQETEEYKVVSEELKEIEKMFAIRFSKTERIYFTVHILSGKSKVNREVQAGFDGGIKSKVIDYVNQMILKVSEVTDVEFYVDEGVYKGLMLHLEPALNRLEYKLPVSNPITQDIKKMYPYVFEVVYLVSKSLGEETGYVLPEEEIAYITIHFQASLERLKKKDGNNKKAIIVCSMGVGISQLLKTKVERNFHSIEILDVVSLSDFNEKVDQLNPDFIMTTVPINDNQLPIIKISPLFDEHEQLKLKAFLDYIEEKKKYPTLRKLLVEELLFLKVRGIGKEKVIEKLVKVLSENGYVQEGYLDTVLEREELSSTAIGGGISIPHGSPEMIECSSLALATLDEPIKWGDEEVSFVLLLSTKMDDKKKTRELFNELVRLSEREGDLKRLLDCEKESELLSLL